MHLQRFVLLAVTIVTAGLLSALSSFAAEPPPQAQQRQVKPSLPLQLPPDTLLIERAPKLSKGEIKRQTETLRKKYPFESVAKRLAYENAFAAAHKDMPSPKLSEEADEHLEAIEVAGQPYPYYPVARRTRALTMLHSEQVEKFISREGFGISRLPQPSPHDLELANTEAVRYPRHLLDSSEDTDTTFRQVPKSAQDQGNPWNLPARELLFGLHRDGQMDFAGPLGLGLVRDRDHVAGFKSHQFRQLPQLITKWDRDITKPQGPPANGGAPPPPPKPIEEWVVRRLELVSLLKREEPAVYVSATLPKMDELAEAETRDLSRFESDSLKTLRSGESLVARAKSNHIEMFGALRAAKQCQQCHQVQRGELLGAFSYELHRNPEFKPSKESASGN